MKRSLLAATVAAVALSISLAGCAFFPGESEPTATPEPQVTLSEDGKTLVFSPEMLERLTEAPLPSTVMAMQAAGYEIVVTDADGAPVDPSAYGAYRTTSIAIEGTTAQVSAAK